MWRFDAERVSQHLLRALRGKRSQTALSRRLGYRSNVLYMWESGRRAPSAHELFRIIERTGGEPARAFLQFPLALAAVPLTEAEGVKQLLNQLRGSNRVADVAARCEVSRFTVSRWLSGRTEPRLPDFLRFVEACTLRVVDLVAAIVDPSLVPEICERHEELKDRRHVAFSHPWSQVLLRVFETEGYKSRPHSDHRVARQLGLSVEEVKTSRQALLDAGVIREERGKFVASPVVLDTSLATKEQRLALKQHWAEVGKTAMTDQKDGLFSWAVFSISRSDYADLKQLHVAYMQSLYRLVGASSPPEVVAAANVQLFGLSLAGPDASVGK